MKATKDNLVAVKPEDAGDVGLRRLIDLAQATLNDEAIKRVWPADEYGLRRLERPERRRRVRWPAVSLVGLAALVLVGAPFAWFAARQPGPLTFEVINGTVGAAGEIQSAGVPSADVGARIRFSDGSEIALDRDARAQVSDVTAVGARIVLSNGRAHTFFVPRPHGHWQVAAGPYVVQVTGTIFDVQWSGDGQAFDVWLQKGSVRVSGPLIGDGLAMTHGQHLLTRMKDRKILLDSQAEPTAEPAPVPAPVEAPAAEPQGHGEGAVGKATEPPAPAPAASAHGPAPGRSWSRRMARGDFEAVVEAAERRGIDAVLAHGSRTELAALADAARYTRRNRLAGRALVAERDRFSDSAEGREAAFFLGTVAEDSGDRGGALTWYGRYLREDASGTYSAQALGRKMLIESRRGSATAGIDAEEYLHRFPSGSYADAARLILKQ